MNRIKKTIKDVKDAIFTLLFISSIFIAVGFGFMAGVLMAHDLFADPVVIMHNGESVLFYVTFSGVSK